MSVASVPSSLKRPLGSHAAGPGASLIGQSSPQEKNLEVTDERDTIVAIAAAGIYL
jgi:hypothetical protein